MTKDKNDIWIESPITKKKDVLVEYDEKNGASYLDISSGYFSNDYPLNYKKCPDFKIERYEKNMPTIMKEVRFDDGERYWYPTTIRNDKGIIYPMGKKGDWNWAYTPIEKLSENESNAASNKNAGIEYKTKLETSKTKYFARFLDACKEMGEINFDGKEKD